MEEQQGVRLQKYLAQCGVASRRKCEEIIAEGRVAINGTVVTEMGTRVMPGDAVTLDGKPLADKEQPVYIAFYKPPFVMTTSDDPEGRKTVLDYFTDFPTRVFSVGRLDFDSEGLLLLTNDGQWANRVTHPSFNLEKEYMVKVKGQLLPAAVQALQAGVMLEGKRTWPAKVQDVRPGGMVTQLAITIHEGRNRQVRKMLEAVGHEVVYLKRTRIGAISLGSMKAGQWRHLTAEEIQSMQQ